jgi:hypothetical protein
MNLNPLFGIGLTLASALVDSQAIVAASRVWKDERLDLTQLGISAIWFFIGFFVYLAALRFLTASGMTDATLQLLCWFGATIVGVALTSGEVFRWPGPRILVAAVAVLALAYVLIDGSKVSPQAAHTTTTPASLEQVPRS